MKYSKRNSCWLTKTCLYNTILFKNAISKHLQWEVICNKSNCLKLFKMVLRLCNGTRNRTEHLHRCSPSQCVTWTECLLVHTSFHRLVGAAGLAQVKFYEQTLLIIKGFSFKVGSSVQMLFNLLLTFCLLKIRKLSMF